MIISNCVFVLKLLIKRKFIILISCFITKTQLEIFNFLFFIILNLINIENIQLDKKSAMKIENETFFQQNNIPLKDNLSMTKKADYEVQKKEMNKLLQISEENLRRQQAEEEIRRIQEKIYENSRKLDNLQTGRSFQNLDSNRSHQGFVHKRLSENQESHEKSEKVKNFD